MLFSEVMRRLQYMIDHPESVRKNTDTSQDRYARDNYTVVWAGRGELLPGRSEKVDNRLASMPSMEWDETTPIKPAEEKRQYNKSGRYVGKFSRINKINGRKQQTEGKPEVIN